MFEKLIYENHFGERIEFDSLAFGKNHGYFLDDDITLADWSFSYDKTNGKIRKRYREVEEFSFGITVVGNSKKEANSMKDHLYDVISVDVLSDEKYGKLIFRDYEMKCICISSAKSNYFADDEFADFKLTIATDKPFWKKCISEYSFSSKEDAGSTLLSAQTLSSDGYVFNDYNYGYDFDYDSIKIIPLSINNPLKLSADFEITIPGHVRNPKLKIGNYSYGVNFDVQENTLLKIDSIEETVKIISSTGAEKNIFHYRNLSSDIFQKIEIGRNRVQLFGNFDVKIKLFEKRGEPRWS